MIPPLRRPKPNTSAHPDKGALEAEITELLNDRYAIRQKDQAAERHQNCGDRDLRYLIQILTVSQGRLHVLLDQFEKSIDLFLGFELFNLGLQLFFIIFFNSALD